MSDRALSLFALTSSSLSSVSAFCPFSSSPLSWSSSSMWSEPPSTRTTAHPQNEEYCPVAIHNPLTDETRRWRGRCVIVREIHNATRFRVATFTRKTPPFHKMPNATLIGLLLTGTLDQRKGVPLSNGLPIGAAGDRSTQAQ